MARTATITLGDKKLEMPVIEGSEGELGIDIAKLRSDTGAITYDPGFGNTGACESAITYIDGDAGILRYRGIPIEQLAEKSRFIEVAWLLIFGRLPKKEELDRFSALLSAHAHINEGMKHHFEGFPSTAPPMAILSSMINTLACFNTDVMDVTSDATFENAAAKLISKVRTIAAYSYRRANGLPFIYPDPKLRYIGNFLHMMFSMPYEHYLADPDIEAALNMILILHADHEQNCSTSTVRVVGSSGANLFASVSAGVCALWGPLHGGANVAVLDMLESIHKGGISPEKCIEMAKDKNGTFRLMGFGHRRLQEFRSAGQDSQGVGRQDPGQGAGERSAAEHRPEAGRTGVEGFVFCGSQALPQRGFLQRHPDEGDWHSAEHVHRDVFDWPAAGVDRPLARNRTSRELKSPGPGRFIPDRRRWTTCRWRSGSVGGHFGHHSTSEAGEIADGFAVVAEKENNIDVLSHF